MAAFWLSALTVHVFSRAAAQHLLLVHLLPQLRWTWQVEEGQHDTAWVELTPATPPGPSIRNMLLELAGSYSTVRVRQGASLPAFLSLAEPSLSIHMFEGLPQRVMVPPCCTE
jgi:hypothetical protein